MAWLPKRDLKSHCRFSRNLWKPWATCASIPVTTRWNIVLGDDADGGLSQNDSKPTNAEVVNHALNSVFEAPPGVEGELPPIEFSNLGFLYGFD